MAEFLSVLFWVGVSVAGLALVYFVPVLTWPFEWLHYVGGRNPGDYRRLAHESPRALALLCEHLTERQKRQLVNYGKFTVRSHGLRYYVRAYSGYGNVRCFGRWCSQWHYRSDHPPRADLLLAQMLLIRTDPRKFRQVAHFMG